MPEQYIVICRADRTPEGAPGRYELATRTVFADHAAATAYMASISTAREPMLVPGLWNELRFGEERGTAAYWDGVVQAVDRMRERSQ